MSEATKILERGEKRALVFISRLSKAERQYLLLGSDAFPDLCLQEKLRNLARELATERLIHAGRCCRVAEFLNAEASKVDEDLKIEFHRTAITKGYYSIHHSLRAILLIRNGWEVDGHQLVINEIELLLKKAKPGTMGGMTDAINVELAQARVNRSIADYSPFNFSREEDRNRKTYVPLDAQASPALNPSEDTESRQRKVHWRHLTEGDWSKAAAFNIELAKKVLLATDKIWTEGA